MNINSNQCRLGMVSIIGLLFAVLSMAGGITNAAEMQDSMNSQNKQLSRQKVLSDAGVYGVFPVFRLQPEWRTLSMDAREEAVSEVLKLVEAHKDKVLVDAYLTRGLVDVGDFFFRVHGYNLDATQVFIDAVMSSTLGSYSTLEDVFVGVTKKLNYASKNPALLKKLKSASYQGEEPKYVIVIPTKKSAEWWNMSEEERLNEMEVHIGPTLNYLTVTKRKLYHSSGLDDLDFITYFEANDLVAFNELVISLLSVPENLSNTQYGDPTLIGTRGSVKEILGRIAD